MVPTIMPEASENIRYFEESEREIIAWING